MSDLSAHPPRTRTISHDTLDSLLAIAQENEWEEVAYMVREEQQRRVVDRER